MGDTDNRMQELALRRVAFAERAQPATDWQARCLAAEAKRDTLAAELVALRPDAALAASLRQILADRGWPMRWDLPLDQMVEKAFLEERRVCCELSVELNTAVNELVALLAGLPRWRKPSQHRWWLQTADGDVLGLVDDRSPWWPTWSRNDDLGSATTFEMGRLMVERSHGLPPCEVEGE